MRSRNDWGDVCDIRYFLGNLINKYQPNLLLDVACGMGYVSRSVHPTTKIVYMDYDQKKIKGIKLRENSEIVQGNLFSLPFKDEAFPFVLAGHCIPGWDFEISPKGRDPKSSRINFLREILRITRPGGTIMITTPNGEHPLYKNKNKGTVQEIRELLKMTKGQISIYGWNQFYSSANNLVKKVYNKIIGLTLFRFNLQARDPISFLKTKAEKGVSFLVLIKKV